MVARRNWFVKKKVLKIIKYDMSMNFMKERRVGVKFDLSCIFFATGLF